MHCLYCDSKFILPWVIESIIFAIAIFTSTIFANWIHFSVIDNRYAYIVHCLLHIARNRWSINHTGSQNYNFEQAKWKLNETNETQSAASITKLKKWNTQYTGNQEKVPTITGHVFVEESRKSDSLSMWCLQLTAQYNEILNNYWMRLTIISWIIKTEVCVICRSEVMRQITQTRGFDNSLYALIGQFSLSASGQTHEFIIYAILMRRARAGTVTIFYCKKQIDVNFSCFCPVIDNGFGHSFVKVEISTYVFRSNGCLN